MKINEKQFKNRSEESLEELFKRYHKLRNDGNRLNSSVIVGDRYMYFVNLSDEIKTKMQAILDDLNESDSRKVLLLSRAMNCKLEKSLVRRHRQRNVYCVEIVCEYDICFANTEPEVYTEILDYMRFALSFKRRELHYQH